MWIRTVIEKSKDFRKGCQTGDLWSSKCDTVVSVNSRVDISVIEGWPCRFEGYPHGLGDSNLSF